MAGSSGVTDSDGKRATQEKVHPRIAVHALLSIGLLAQLGAALPADSVERLGNRARSAEARFERLSRQLAPLAWSGFSGYDCDEIVGRFCLRFDSASVRPAALDSEAARVVDARREAVEALRRYFSAAPGERSSAGPLVRLLIRDGRAAEAASAAGAFAALSRDTLWGELLQGLALHWAGDGVRAERHFVSALRHLPAEERRRWLDPAWLLDPAESRSVGRMSEAARTDYERRFWLVVDPFWLTPENERWNEHIARHAEARLLADVPVVAGMVRWGRDLDELIVRYGTPTTRARQRSQGISTARPGMVEYWDTVQRAYVPPRMSSGLPPPPLPGDRPLLYAAAARSAFTLRSVDRVIELTHQVTRFVRGDSVLLRVDAAMPYPDDLAAGPPEAGAPAQPPATRTTAPLAGLFVYDSTFTRRQSATRVAAIDADTTRAVLFAAASPGHLIYGVEMLGDSVALAGRARYALDAHLPPSGPVLSDLLIARRFDSGDTPDRMDDPRLRAFASLIFQPGDTLGIYAEVYRLGRAGAVDIEVALEDASRPSLIGRFARWIGRGLGLVEARVDPRVGWRGEAADARFVVALNVPLAEDRDGMHDLVLMVTDPVTGEVTEARRRILIRGP
jgi:hypothetical protein